MARIRLLLVGDVMTGRGIDQILPCPSRPRLYEDYVRSAEDYVALAEDRHGAIPRRTPPSYIWGDALAEIARGAPDLRIVNLETAVTRAGRPAPKGINYRMHPGNVGCLSAFGIDCCVLANNHVLDWGAPGLAETLETLETAGIGTAGAGRNRRAARAPATLPLPDKGRVLVYGLALTSSGVPAHWAAGARRAGINHFDDADPAISEDLARRLAHDRRPGDVVVCSIHWGPNWGYGIDERHRALAHALIGCGADVIHGHSSHHPKAFEIHDDRLILYGCGDFINDYEGIAGHEEYRPDLTVAYLVTLDAGSGAFADLLMLPFQTSRFRLATPARQDIDWLRRRLDDEVRPFGLAVAARDERALGIVRAAIR